MKRGRFWGGWLAGLVLVVGPSRVEAADTFSVATYNLENYLISGTPTRPVKSAASRAGIRASLLALRAEVLALQEVGNAASLTELRATLSAEGLDYPYEELVPGADTNALVAVLSRLPIIARRSHTNESFLLQGRRFWTSRGFAEVDIAVNPHYTVTLLTAHLKSRRPELRADEAEIREQEALLLREKIDARLKANPQANLIVLGDFNDTKDSRALRVIVGRGKQALADTRPAERNGDDPAPRSGRADARRITWTYYYRTEDSYDRIDYLLISRGMEREWDPEGTYLLALPNWGVASDHRPIVARFFATDR